LVLRVAAVGCGRWGKNIVRVLRELHGEGLIELTAVVDRDYMRAKAVAAEFGVEEVFDDPDKLIDRGIDAVTVAVPINKLADLAELFISSGIHTFIEKPVSTEPEVVARLRSLAQSRGIVAVPGFIMRFNPAVQELKKLIRDVGDVRYIVFKRLSRRPSHFREFPIVYDLMIHDIDLMSYFFGRCSYSHLLTEALKIAEDLMVVSLVRCDGALTLFHTDGIAPAKVREIDIVSDRAYLRADTETLKVIVKTATESDVKIVKGEEPLKAELRAFIMKVAGKDLESSPSLDDAYRAIELAKEINSSVEKQTLHYSLNN
jgi:UDP-N-acetylglucosamine 3-dehydrogenase